ncbi:hypothetical protein FIV06_00195 [Labrenzia sp. THAF191b]|jgi:hypothetical protein|nr:hypothetical protein FIV06_00195 [Labrenzia sp. THAF191b]QFT02128.1 hypothetical protein FIV05_00195 [Labrenzia sp. THAF191a]QFT13669.1 hypothetical protein FIV03_00195 [Labrenzia sp. THAF187b]
MTYIVEHWPAGFFTNPSDQYGKPGSGPLHSPADVVKLSGRYEKLAINAVRVEGVGR